MTDEAREALEKFAVLSPDAGRDALWRPVTVP